jgi:hypothetical protein
MFAIATNAVLDVPYAASSDDIRLLTRVSSVYCSLKIIPKYILHNRKFRSGSMLGWLTFVFSVSMNLTAALGFSMRPQLPSPICTLLSRVPVLRAKRGAYPKNILDCFKASEGIAEQSRCCIPAENAIERAHLGPFLDRSCSMFEKSKRQL